MRYSNEELFFITEEEYQSWLDNMTAREFFKTCINRLEWNIAGSLNKPNWMDDENNHLRNYRLKAIRFYERKLCL